MKVKPIEALSLAFFALLQPLNYGKIIHRSTWETPEAFSEINCSVLAEIGYELKKFFLTFLMKPALLSLWSSCLSLLSILLQFCWSLNHEEQ